MAKKSPKVEIFSLGSQIKRAADSVVLNIAEGSTGQSNAEFKRFLNIALRSAIEVVACLYLAKKENIFPMMNTKSITHNMKYYVK